MTLGMAGCSISPRVKNAGTDPAVLATCPRTVTAPGELVGVTVLVIPDGQFAGMRVVPDGNRIERENMLLRGATVYKGAYEACRSVVIYVEDRDVSLSE